MRVILELHACNTRISLYVRGTNASTAARFQVVRSQGYIAFYALVTKYRDTRKVEDRPKAQAPTKLSSGRDVTRRPRARVY